MNKRPASAAESGLERNAISARPARPQLPQRITSEQLFGSALEIEIDHRGTRYRLRQTSLGKLILTK